MMIARFLRARFLGSTTEAATAEASGAAESELATAGTGETVTEVESVVVAEEVLPIVEATVWETLLCPFLVEFSIAAIIAIAEVILWYLFVKDYYLEVRLYNFYSKSAFTVTDWYADNAEVVGENWKSKKIDTYSGTFELNFRSVSLVTDFMAKIQRTVHSET